MKDLSQNLKEEKCHPRPEIEWRCRGVRLAETKSLLGLGTQEVRFWAPRRWGSAGWRTQKFSITHVAGARFRALRHVKWGTPSSWRHSTKENVFTFFLKPSISKSSLRAQGTWGSEPAPAGLQGPAVSSCYCCWLNVPSYSRGQEKAVAPLLVWGRQTRSEI